MEELKQKLKEIGATEIKTEFINKREEIQGRINNKYFRFVYDNGDVDFLVNRLKEDLKTI